MISAKRIAQLAKKWQRMAVLGRKCLTLAVGSKGSRRVLHLHGEQGPLCFGTAVFAELLQMSQEEFSFGGDDGRITLPCDAAVMEYAMCLLRRGASAEVEKAFLSTMAMSCHYASHVAPYVAACC